MTTTIATTASVTVQGKELAAALRAVKGAAETPARAMRYLRPELAHVELIATRGEAALALRTNGLERMARVVIPATLSDVEAVSVSVPLAALAATLKNVKTRESVTLEIGHHAVSVFHADGVDYVDTIGADAPPAAPDMLGAEQLLTMNAGELVAALQRAKMATSTDATLPVLTGVNLFEHDGAWTLAATDRYRMSFEALPVAAAAAAPSVLIPAGVVAVLAAALDPGALVVVEILGEHVSFRQCGAEVTALSIRADFPRVASLLPNAEGPVTFTADRASLELAVRACFPAKMKRNSYAVDMRSTGARFTLQGVDRHQDSEGLEAVSFEATDAEQDWDRMANAAFLLDMLDGKGAAEVRFRTQQTPNKPMLITRDDRPGWRGLLMPIRRAG